MLGKLPSLTLGHARGNVTEGSGADMSVASPVHVQGPVIRYHDDCQACLEFMALQVLKGISAHSGLRAELVRLAQLDLGISLEDLEKLQERVRLLEGRGQLTKRELNSLEAPIGLPQ